MESVQNAICYRIMRSHLNLLSEFGPLAVTDAAQAVAEHVGEVEEIGTSDVSAWVREVEQMLGYIG